MYSNTLKFLIFIGLLFLAGCVLAQTKFIVLQDEELNQADPCELAAQSSMVIDPATGDIAVTVVDLEACLGTTDALNVSPVLTTPSPVIAGNSLEVLWASVGALSCQPSTTGGSILPGWSTELIGLQGPHTFSVPAATPASTYNLGVSCTDGELTVTQTAQVQVVEPDLGDPPTITGFTVNGNSLSTSIEPGSSVAIVWSSNGATSCQAGGNLTGWSGSKAISGNLDITDTASLVIGSAYDVTLRCSNAAGNSPTVSRTVNILDPLDPPPSVCEDRPLLGQGALANWTRKTTGQNSCVWRLPTQGTGLDTDADCRFFDQVWSSPWPGSANSRNLTVSSPSGREFIAMEFNSGNIPAGHTGRMTQEVPQFAGAQSGNKMWSISKCPGDFNKSLVDSEMGPSCVKRDQFGATDAFRWGGANSASDPFVCGMQPNTRYYLNIVWTNDQAGTPPADIQPNPLCVGNRCGGIFAPAETYNP